MKPECLSVLRKLSILPRLKAFRKHVLREILDGYGIDYEEFEQEYVKVCGGDPPIMPM